MTVGIVGGPRVGELFKVEIVVMDRVGGHKNIVFTASVRVGA